MQDLDITPSGVKSAARQLGATAEDVLGLGSALADQAGATAQPGFLVDGALAMVAGKWRARVADIAKHADAFAETTWQAADAYVRLSEQQVRMIRDSFAEREG